MKKALTGAEPIVPARWIAALALMWAATVGHAQQVLVFDKETGKPLPGVELVLRGLATGVYSNDSGLMLLEIPTGTREVGFFAPGYQVGYYSPDALDTLYHIGLQPMYVVLGAVDILGSKAPSISQAPGAFTLSANQLSRLPSVFAEPDPIRGLLLLPGVGGVLENNVGLAVRGGAVAQTLTTIDGATLWQSGHAAGFFSALHHQSVDQVTLYKEAPPGHLGGRASAYLDIGLRQEFWEAATSCIPRNTLYLPHLPNLHSLTTHKIF